MALLLNIDTALETGGVCISSNDEILAMESNKIPRDHAAFLHPCVERLLSLCNISLNNIDAISVTAGPGSYTGLRIGMAAAKGFCFALNKPLITINTLEVMAMAALSHLKDKKDALLCPMIDARRMEVFTMLLDCNLNTIEKPQAMVLEKMPFDKYSENNKLIFFGNGSDKLKSFQIDTNEEIISVSHNVSDLAKLASKAYIKKEFADIAYSEPFYLKAFYTTARI